MSIRYTRVGWQDAPSTDTPVDAANLNHMDNGILAISEELDTELPLVREQISDASGEVSQLKTYQSHQLDDTTFVFGQGACSIFACAASWLRNNDKLYYGNNGNCNSFNVVSEENVVPVTSPKSETILDGRYPIDCMNFVEMCLRGIGFEESAYGDGSNISKYPRMSLDWKKWDFVKYAFVQDNTVETTPVIEPTEDDWKSSPNYRRVLTWQFARFFRDHGLYTPIHEYNSNELNHILQAGDIVWFGNPSSADFGNRFGGIYHCAIFVYANKDGNPVILDATSDDPDNTLRIRTPGGAHSAARIVGYSRVPLGDLGGMGLKSNINLLLDSCNLQYQSSEIVYLKVRSQKWNVYKFTVAYLYTDASDIKTSFPAIWWDPPDFILNRLTESTTQAKEANKWYICDIVVSMDDSHALFSAVQSRITDANDRFSVRMYPEPSNAAYVRCISVTPILLRENERFSDGYFELEDRYSSEIFASHSALAKWAYDTFGKRISTGRSMVLSGLFTINSSYDRFMIKIIRIRSDVCKIGVYNNTLSGVVATLKHSDTDFTYQEYGIGTFPIESWVS